MRIHQRAGSRDYSITDGKCTIRISSEIPFSSYGDPNRFKDLGLPGGKLHSDSETPIGVIVDATGSMGGWPPIIMKQLEKLHDELEDYAPGFEMSVAVVGDAHSDRSPRQPLQVCNFTKGKELTDFLKFFSYQSNLIRQRFDYFIFLEKF